ncbi:hypothetical protein LTR56_024367 [Elasticomyces elasticus]|nr:hypothetical protein LTR56_024367 [Elasticomyces elasticus]KAK3644077.1 hypothetical protein LTR22_015399 [Elasticomyces elasticus]KAK4922001.1 hypothetical protein LTR49_010586 [Elasticomyces elasticus]KAK5768818.1 hypothetical protein LTS12_000878 [Elasticomyces elasticus]
MATEAQRALMGCGTKRSFSGTPLVGSNHMRSLYQPTMVTICAEYDEEYQEYQVPRGLIRASSKYFDKAFGGDFEEGRLGKITLPDTKPWVFECFIGWLTLDQPFLDQQSHTEGAAELTNADLIDPVAWLDYDLFDLYIFADKYDTQLLRKAVMEVIQIKVFQTLPFSYLFPSKSDLAHAFRHLPDTSPLYRLLTEIMVYDTDPDVVAESDRPEVLPSRALCEVLVRTTQLARCAECSQCKHGHPCLDKSHADIKSTRAPYCKSLCVYHEHDSEEEQKMCEVKWERIKMEKGIEF